MLTTKKGALALTVLIFLVVPGCSAEGAGTEEGPTTTPTSEAPAEAGSGSESAPSTSATQEEASQVCELLSEDDVAQLVDVRISGRDEVAIGGPGGMPACQWQGADGVWVQATSVPAELWGRTVPGVMETLRNSGAVTDAKNLRKLEEGAALVSSGHELEPSEACELFSAMLEINGLSQSMNWTINYVPSKDDPQALSGQACVDGEYHSVMLVRPDLAISPELEEAVSKALHTLIEP